MAFTGVSYPSAFKPYKRISTAFERHKSAAAAPYPKQMMPSTNTHLLQVKRYRPVTVILPRGFVHLTPVAPQSPNKPWRRFSSSQLAVLEQQFVRTTHPNLSTRRRLAAVIQVDETKVRNWFHNRNRTARVKSRQAAHRSLDLSQNPEDKQLESQEFQSATDIAANSEDAVKIEGSPLDTANKQSAKAIPQHNSVKGGNLTAAPPLFFKSVAVPFQVSAGHLQMYSATSGQVPFNGRHGQPLIRYSYQALPSVSRFAAYPKKSQAAIVARMTRAVVEPRTVSPHLAERNQRARQKYLDYLDQHVRCAT